MKRINEHRKLFNIEGAIDLKDLTTKYRGLVKEWHPDKFQDEEKKHEAGIRSQNIIEGYTISTTQSQIVDFHHKGLLMEISFANGTTYEYFGVSKKLFDKFINSDKQYRFAKRNIFNSFLYRKSKNDLEIA